MAYHEVSKETAHRFTASVAEHLGPGWTYVPPDEDSHQNKITGPQGEILWFRYGGYQLKDRMAVSGGFPYGIRGSYHPYRGGSFEVTVRQDRGTAVVAKEIERRLLPAYRPALLKALADKATDESQRAEQLRRYQVLADVVGKAYNPEHFSRNPSSLPPLYFNLPGGVSGDLEVYHNGEVNMKLHGVAFGAAVAIVKMLAPPPLAPAEHVAQLLFGKFGQDVERKRKEAA